MYDEEAIYQDADIEQAEYEAEARRIDALRESGVCVHGHTQWHTPKFRPDLAPGEGECLECGERFPSEDAYHEARQVALS